MSLQAPFPWFGGKSKVASVVWERFGDVKNYVEPFAGSLAVLLGRPFEPRIETINDLDGMVVNFWRALKSDPNGVAKHATNPVSECDLHARHCYLLASLNELESRLCGDPDFCDPKIAGWWVWGLACWIGGGFCTDCGPWWIVDGKFVRNAGRGVKKQLPHLGNAGRGVTKQLPHLGDAGRGVTKQLPHLGDGPFDPSEGLLEWFNALALRLRTVRVCCGDWARVVGQSVTTKNGMTGVFLDPPYGHGIRAAVYARDECDVTQAVHAYCMENAENPLLRIALCGYEGEYDLPGWSVVQWKASGGYGSRGDGRGRSNASRERIWFSPNCLQPPKPDDGLFA